MRLRIENPSYGKAKIAVLLKRDHKVHLSESSTGRCLKKLLMSGKIDCSISSYRIKRKRKFINHAKKWQYGMKASSPGEMVQIDHMSVSKNQKYFKHFQAWDPITKTIVAEATSNANSSTAAHFLKKVIQELPFKIKSIQVDGGSEFMKYFETECAKQNIELYVLPPKRPQYNGGVERGNRIFREEFYARSDMLADSIGAIKYELDKAVKKYNTYRPHFSLKGLTPLQYTTQILETSPSHII